jgi:hypothetical protein
MFIICITQLFGIKAELAVICHLAIALMTISGIAHVRVTALRTLGLPALVCILVIVTRRITLCVVLAVTLFSCHWVTLIPMSMAFTPVTHHHKYIDHIQQICILITEYLETPMQKLTLKCGYNLWKKKYCSLHRRKTLALAVKTPAEV